MATPACGEVRYGAGLWVMGHVLVFTNNSAKQVDGVGWVASYCVYVPGTTALSALLLVSLRQSNNVAGLQGADRPSKFPQIAQSTDSNFVYLGAIGAA